MKIGKFYFDLMFVVGFAALIIVIIVAFAGLFMALNASANNNNRLMQQCMDDGRKEYECRSMLFNGLE